MSEGTQGDPRRGKLPRGIAGAFLLVSLVATVVLAFAFYAIHQNHSLARQGREAHDALCVLKADYRHRLRVGRRFLHEHPNGIPGVKVGVIRASVTNQKATLRSLKPLHCDGDT